MTVSTQARTPFKIAVLPGDGIGPEVIAEALKVLKYLSERFQIPLHLEMAPIGGAALEASGEPLPKATLDLCQSADAVLMGSVGNPKYDTLPPEKRPEQGLLGLRKSLGLFANLRPVTLFKPLTFASTLKPEVLEGVDVLVVRELTGGIYFGRPRERDDQKALDTMTYTREEIERIVRLGFELAQTRRKHLTSVDKANVLACSQLWRSVVDAIAPEYPDVTCEHMYVDNAAMQLILNPRQFDVLLTENMFGDILSDEASMLTGSLGMLASASLSGYGSSAKIDEKQPALYEPSHGSAPDIAGQQKANPLATILSVQMMLEYSLNCPEVAVLIPQAVEQVLQMGIRTADIAEPGATIVTTAQMGDKVLEVLVSLPDPQPCTEKAQAVCVS